MRIEYDGDADILYLQFKAARQVMTVEVTERLYVDLDADGAVAGIEVLDASEQIGTDNFGLVKEVRPKRVRRAPTR